VRVDLGFSERVYGLGPAFFPPYVLLEIPGWWNAGGPQVDCSHFDLLGLVTIVTASISR
jgi:hypothetical protein